MTTNLNWLAGFSALALAGCSQNVAPTDSKTTETPEFTANIDPVDHTSRYTFADGTTDYALLRKDFGEPNTNIIYNPRATDVSKTASRNAVTAAPDRLTFVASKAAWLDQKKVGDTLYCNAACGGHGFMRNIASVEKKDGLVVVQTTEAAMTDIVLHGWLHSEVPLQTKEQLAANPGVPGPNGLTPMEENDTATKPEATITAGKTYPFTGSVSGSMTATASFQATIKTDLAIGLQWSWSAPVTIDLFQVVATGTPSVDFRTNLTVKAAITKEFELGEKFEQELGEIPLGPILLVPTLGYEWSGEIAFGGATTINVAANAKDTVKIGFRYTSAAGASPIFSNKFTTTNSINMTGKVTAEAKVTLKESLDFKIFDLAGPGFVLAPAVGFEGEGTLKTTPECAIEVEGNFFFKVGAKVEAVVGRAPLKYSASFPLADTATLKFPDPPWKHEIVLAETNPLCPQHHSTSSSGHSSSSGTHGSSTGTHSSSTGGGTTGTHSTSGGTSSHSTAASTTGNTTGGTTGGTSTTATGTTGTTGVAGTTSTSTTGTGTTGTTGTNASSSTTGTTNPSDCGSGPVDLNSDPNNCGFCGLVCTEYTSDPGSQCSGGSCSCHCPNGTLCPSTDTASCD